MLPDITISSYHLSLDCDVLSLDASPIVDRNIDEEKTLDLMGIRKKRERKKRIYDKR